MTRTRGTRGASLAAVLVIGAIAFQLLWSLFSVSSYHLRFTDHVIDSHKATDYANSAILLAIAHLKASPDFQARLGYRPAGAAPGDGGSLTFTGPGPHSTNNLVAGSASAGWNHTVVPPHAADLVAVGRCGGQRVVCEAVVHIPPFPYSLATNGRIISLGHVNVYALASLSQVGASNRNQKLPADIVCNAGDKAGPSVAVAEQTHVVGDIRSAGTVMLIPPEEFGPSGRFYTGGFYHDRFREPAASRVLQHQRPIALPTIDAHQFDPADLPYTYAYVPGTTTSITGRVRYAGDLNVLGDLTLNGGLLYVNGNLNIIGHVRGRGAIVATGDIKVCGSANVSSDFAALVAGGDITIAGDGAERSSFQGLAYAGGSLHVQDVRIVGSFIQADAHGITRLNDVQAVSVPGMATINLSQGTPLGVNWGNSDPNVSDNGVHFIPKTLADVPRNAQGSYDSSPAAVAGLIRFTVNGQGPYSNPSQLPPGATRQAAQDRYTRLAAALPGAIQAANAQAAPPTQDIFHLDLDQLLHLSDGLRVLRWRRIAG